MSTLNFFFFFAIVFLKTFFYNTIRHINIIYSILGGTFFHLEELSHCLNGLVAEPPMFQNVIIIIKEVVITYKSISIGKV